MVLRRTEQQRHGMTEISGSGTDANSISVRDSPGSDAIVGALDLDMIVQGEASSTAGFLHRTIREGRAGLVKRTDVRWLPFSHRLT